MATCKICSKELKNINGDIEKHSKRIRRWISKRHGSSHGHLVINCEMYAASTAPRAATGAHANVWGDGGGGCWCDWVWSVESAICVSGLVMCVKM